MIVYREKLHITIGLLAIILSIAATVFVQPNISPEFAGRGELNIRYSNVVDLNTIVNEDILSFEYTEGVHKIVTNPLSDQEFLTLNEDLKSLGQFEVLQFQSFSSEISQDLLRKSIVALILAMIIIIIFISIAFLKASRKVSSYKYGVVSIVALIHDSIIPVGIFSLLSFTGASLDVLFTTAILAIIGYSINDTIVVFDRVRERLLIADEPFMESVEYGVRNSVRRSIYTSVSTVIPLILLFILVPVTKWFALTMFVGIVAGTYSSLFFAPALLIMWDRLSPEEGTKDKDQDELEKAEDELRNILKGQNTI